MAARGAPGRTAGGDVDCDVAVVGAGPAGAAAALAALRLDPSRSVLLLDKAAFPRDKACGDGIGPHAGDELGLLGVPGAFDGYPPLRRLRIRAPGGAQAVGEARRDNHVVPRAVFDARLVATAVARGARLRTERVRSLRDQGRYVVVNSRLRARVVVGADGANSSVRRLLGVGSNPPGHLAIAVRGYAPAPPGPPEQLIDLVEAGWPAYWWSFPVGDGRANVGYGLVRHGLDDGRGQLYGRLARLLPGRPADPATLRAHHLPLSTHRPPPARGRVLLAGDAASLVNPLTGEGIYYALASGRLAGTAAVLAPDAPGGLYRRLLRRELGGHLAHTGVLARAGRHVPLTAAAVAAAAGSPAVFDTLVELGLGRGRMSARALARILAAYRPR
ncbi:MAG: NAD(P)/FAD-dependent oxidoreductase [Actinobacteria bacterium]|nr:NAD(P)/FAD-dependent oxidoreductase [Actinomycetota bacterium]